MANQARPQDEPTDLTCREKILLAEYDKIQDIQKHYDNINMSLMSIITAGVFVIWGIAFQADVVQSATLVVFLELSISAILCIWIRYMSIHRRIVVQKLARIAIIEYMLGMKQHRIFQYDYPARQTVRQKPGGHGAELYLFNVLAWFSVFVALHVQLAPTQPAYSDPVGAYARSWIANIRSTWGTLHYLMVTLSLLPALIAPLWSLRCRVEVVRFIRGYQFHGLSGWLLRKMR